MIEVYKNDHEGVVYSYACEDDMHKVFPLVAEYAKGKCGTWCFLPPPEKQGHEGKPGYIGLKYGGDKASCFSLSCLLTSRFRENYSRETIDLAGEFIRQEIKTYGGMDRVPGYTEMCK